MPKIKKRKVVEEIEKSVRFDGKVNVWRRTLGRYGWTDWTLVNVFILRRWVK